jgi:hypothetical protein
MRYIVSLSGGISSAVAADRAIQRYGRRKVTLWFADTLAEDEDLYRFIEDCMHRWGGKLYRFEDGRTPEQVAEDKRIIPNQKIAPCTHILKIEPFKRWLWRVPKNVTVILGYNWSEIRRIEKRQHWHKYNGKWRPPAGYQAEIPGVYEDYPLLWHPVMHDPFAEVKSWGIEIPRLYKLGFDHNNCGGVCFRQSIADWMLARDFLADNFNGKVAWESAMQERFGMQYTIIRDQRNGSVKPLLLSTLHSRQRVRQQPGDELQQSLFEDRFSCICGV